MLKAKIPFVRILCLVMLVGVISTASAASPSFDGPEDLSSYYGLPDPFTFLDGSKVETLDDWADRRAEILDMLQYYEYGYVHIPEITSVTRSGNQINYTMSNAPQVAIDPSLALRTVSVSVTFSFNAANGVGNRDHLPVMIGGSNSDGFASSGWPGNTNQGGGGGLTTYTGTYYTLYPYVRGSLEYDTGKLIAGGWEVGRLVDALLIANADPENKLFPEIDPYGLIPTGFSQGGKRALLAAAIDERVALGFPGHAGAWGNSSVRFINDAKKYPTGNNASKTNYTEIDTYSMFSGATGQRSEQMNQQHGSSYDGWFTYRFQDWSRGDRGHSGNRYPISETNPSNLDKWPVDQHLLLALMAPRPLLLTEGMDDFWNDPEGSATMHAAAKKVYEFFGVPELCNILINPSTEHSAKSIDRATAAALYNYAYRGIEPTFTERGANETWATYVGRSIVAPDFNINAFNVINPTAITFAKPGQYTLSTNGAYSGRDYHVESFIEGLGTVIPVTSDADRVQLLNSEGEKVADAPVEGGVALLNVTGDDAIAGVYTIKTVGSYKTENAIKIECRTWEYTFRPEVLKEGNHRYFAFANKINSVDAVVSLDTLEAWMVIPENAASVPFATADEFIRFGVYDAANTDRNNYRQNMQYGIRIIALAGNGSLNSGTIGYWDNGARRTVNFGAPKTVTISNIVIPNLFPGFTFDLAMDIAANRVL